MSGEKILLDWARSYQEEIRREVEMIYWARQVPARASRQQASGGSMLAQLLRVCGFGRRALETPGTSRATA